MKRPNIRKLFIPAPGHIIADCDLAKADAQVVAWEAGDEKLKQAFREDINLHLQNARDIYGYCPDKNHSNYDRAKAGVHATNYGCSAKTLAGHIGTTVREAERFQQQWFSAHPEIREWHRRIKAILQGRPPIRICNAFGFCRTYFERDSPQLLSKVLAWVPQSTVALVTNFGIISACGTKHISEESYLTQPSQTRPMVPEATLLNQVHDSTVWQWPIELDAIVRPKLAKALHVTVPYPDPLIIPVGISVSDKSWGDVKTSSWTEVWGHAETTS